MHVFGAFELDIQPGISDDPASIRVALLRYIRARTGVSSSLRSAHPSKNRRLFCGPDGETGGISRSTSEGFR